MVAKYNLLRAETLTTLQGNAAMMTLVAGRIYPRSMAELSVDGDGVDVSNITFPATTFRIVGIGRAGGDTTGALSQPQMLVQHWSKNDYSEAWEMAAAFETALHRQYLTVSGVSFVWQVTNKGQEVFDPDQQLYYVVQQFTATMAG